MLPIRWQLVWFDNRIPYLLTILLEEHRCEPILNRINNGGVLTVWKVNCSH
ncbi:hypothetical protein SAMN06266787_1206 [Halorubrum ezzemoulense]|uniref:Uncharacterized protein n=1 Tax=Halorubrum ezzemoulense TaxID=337243 RepID=A0A238YVM8_HALEZ|nr:hypothetical protein SAMN06266787_1206 [Halorubrum ezzemoulense]